MKFGYDNRISRHPIYKKEEFYKKRECLRPKKYFCE